MFLKISVFWDMTPCSLVECADVSKDIFAYLKYTMEAAEPSGTSHFKEQSLFNKQFGHLLFQRLVCFSGSL